MRHIEAPLRSASCRPRSEAIDTLVLHYTELDLQQSLAILCDGPVSVHWLLDVDGTAYRLVDEELVAYHAGLSMWRGRKAVNERSAGIEIVNLNGNHHPYPEQQIAALIALCEDILARHRGIAAAGVVGHSDIAPKRKVDPGILFPWRRLAAAGIGLWPEAERVKAGDRAADVLRLLQRCGYPPPHGYGWKDSLPALFALGEPVRPDRDEVVWVEEADLIAAFQRRFRPRQVDGIADGETLALLRGLARLSA